MRTFSGLVLIIQIGVLSVILTTTSGCSPAPATPATRTYTGTPSGGQTLDDLAPRVVEI